MSDDTYTTGNSERDTMLRAAIAKVIGRAQTPSMKLVTRALPGDFFLDSEEYLGTLQALGVIEVEHAPAPAPEPVEPPPQARPTDIMRDTPDGRPLAAAPPETLDKIGSLRASESEQPDDDTANTTPHPKISEGQARAMADTANRRLDLARANFAIGQGKLKSLRADLATRIYEWQLLGRPIAMTREALMRSHIASEQATKQRRADAGKRGQRMSTSKFPAQDPRTGRMGTKGNHRGAYPSTYQNRRVPSDR
ncbi:MAG TPA: hypothetical protein VMV59_07020 [Candidatus Dormibacteraeota bacterium]|nr:hypothetical protein [Candidatus Dormibacteraeota bacterium]